MDNSKTELFESMPIPKAVVTLSVPSVISSLVMVIYSLADTFFVGMMNDPVQNAAVTLAAPLLLAFNAVNNLFGIGSSSMMSRALGRKDYDTVYRSSAFGFYASLICSLLFSLLYGVLQSPILVMLGANAETIQATADYLFWTVLLGSAPSILNVVLAYLVRAEGSSLHASIGTMCGCLLNIVLDPIFIFTFKWGMAGAAAATVIGQIVTAILSVLYLLRARVIRSKREDFLPEARIIRKTLSLGLSSFLAQISLVGAMLAINNMLRRYGAADEIFGQEQYAQIPMAVVGIVMKFFQIVISVVIGMAAGCIPVVGFNMGAGQKGRVKELFTRLLIAEACVGAAALFIAEVFPGALIRIFGAANESVYYTEFAVKSFRIYLCMTVLACVNKATFIFMQAMGRAVESVALSMVREIVFGVGFALLLPVFFGLDGVLYSMPLSDILTGVISAIIIVKTYKELSQKEGAGAAA